MKGISLVALLLVRARCLDPELTKTNTKDPMTSLICTPAFTFSDTDQLPEEITFSCLNAVYTVSKTDFERDCSRAKKVLEESLNPQFAKGWEIFFTFLQKPSAWKFTTIEEFFQLVNCVLLTGSQGWIAAITKLPLEELCSDFQTAWKLLETLTHPEQSEDGLLRFLQTTFMQLSIRESQKDKPEHLRIVERRSTAMQDVRLSLVPQALVHHLTSLFSNLRHFCLTTPQLLPTLQTLLPQFKQLRHISLQVDPSRDFPLALFESCGQLERIIVEGSELPIRDTLAGINPFKNPQALPHLSHLTLRQVKLKDSLGSIVKLPNLSELDLKDSRLSSLQKSLRQLRDCKKLTSLNVSNLLPSGFFRECLDGFVTYRDGCHDSYLNGPTLLLSKALPNLNITPKPQMKDYRYFDEVIISQDQLNALNSPSKYVYAPNDVDSATNQQLAALLTQVKSEHKNWPVEDATHDDNVRYNGGYPKDMYPAYDHNRYKGLDPAYVNVSCIDCFDGRQRLAMQEPVSQNAKGKFWTMVEQDVSLIVMVKEQKDDPYYPVKAGEPVTYIGPKGQSIIVELIETMPISLNITRRTFKVGQKTVSHLQVNWVDNHGHDPDELLTLLHHIIAIEDQNPGATCVHCAAGVGRTGTLLGALFMLKRLQNQNKDVLFNLEALLRGLRQWRMWMILRSAQLRTLLDLFKLIQS